jgi:hypothetical protein
MPTAQKDCLAAEVQERWIEFQIALSDKRKYPVQQFRQFWEAGRRYAELTKRDALIHRTVVSAVNGLTEFLSVAAKKGTSSAVEREPGVGLRSGLRWGAERGKKLTASSLRRDCPRF